MRFADQIGDEIERSYRVLQEVAGDFSKEPFPDEPEVGRYGPCLMAYDEVPIVERVAGKRNLFVAAGHNLLGLSTAASAGGLVSELIDGASPSLDPTPCGITRFG